MAFTDPTRPPLTKDQKNEISRRLLKLLLREELGIMSHAKFIVTLQKAADETGVDFHQLREVAEELLRELYAEMLGNGSSHDSRHRPASSGGGPVM